MYDVGVWTILSWLKIWPYVGFRYCTVREFVDKLIGFQDFYYPGLWSVSAVTWIFFVVHSIANSRTLDVQLYQAVTLHITDLSGQTRI
jgi:apolipoprotein N-acyltransferase